MRVGRVLALACAALLAACQSVIGAEFDDVERVDCKRAVPPPRPSVTNAGDTSDEIFAAITSVEFGDTDRSDQSVGFDLDGVCAGQGERPSCRGFAWSGADPTDGVGGIDNSGGALLYADDRVFGIPALSSEDITKKIKRGTVAPLAIVRISGWNDRSMDDAIEVDWYVAERLGKTLSETEKEAWPVWEKTFADGAPRPVPGERFPNSRFRAERAYVNNYVAVARFPGGTVLNVNNVPFKMEGLVLAVTLGYGPPRILKGTIAGVVPRAEMFGKLTQMTQSFDFKAPMCRDDVVYPQVKGYLCQFMDSHADGRNDPEADCDAISLGVNILETRSIVPGPLAAAPEYTTCAPNVDPANDSCAIPAVVP